MPPLLPDLVSPASCLFPGLVVSELAQIVRGPPPYLEELSVSHSYTRHRHLVNDYYQSPTLNHQTCTLSSLLVLQTNQYP